VKYRVRLTAKAEEDIASVLRWFHEQRATDAGERWVRRLMAKIDTLETGPDRAAIADESTDLGLEIRELLFGKRHKGHRILFRIEKTTVHILRVWHAARDRLSSDDL
jgi:plasmid stabilization system protein ParE